MKHWSEYSAEEQEDSRSELAELRKDKEELKSLWWDYWLSDNDKPPIAETLRILGIPLDKEE